MGIITLLDSFFMKAAGYLEVYAKWFSDRPIAATIIIYVIGFACGTWAAYSAM